MHTHIHISFRSRPIDCSLSGVQYIVVLVASVAAVDIYVIIYAQNEQYNLKLSLKLWKSTDSMLSVFAISNRLSLFRSTSQKPRSIFDW